ncbi:ABC transporter ATP-binding protein [Nocardioides daphniae]|uniref:ABC transporter ATP-binding protein n=1 Tax=Nocardioides daphniae TaxID=402297 RepID=A0A4V1CWR8_9ACTN|nr:ABC transporter ATP-binding protein [Nocardioides daphniae]QCC78217.1 ABC transporter ATP-binding protein [Nocardioides daphniae]GGD20841.1 multidrug ABC transporter ATP-binding protein [Nocardioides daphniae]
MTERNPHAVEVAGLRRTYGSGDDAFEAVRGVDLTVRPGTVHALLGVNGAGKTSTLEVIEGLAAASAGQVRVLGLDPVADRREVRRRTGVLLQRSGFVADLTVRETLQMWAATVTDARPVEESLRMLDLERVADTRMRGLSGGEHRRVDLACALTGHPELVVLDEPTTGLDPESRRAVWRLVRELRDGGATVLLTTHYLEEAEQLADQVSIMRAGEIVREGTVAEIIAGHPSEISFRGHLELPWPTGAEVSHDGETTVLRVADLQPALTDLLVSARAAGVSLPMLDARSATLESVFLALAADREGVRA